MRLRDVCETLPAHQRNKQGMIKLFITAGEAIKLPNREKFIDSLLMLPKLLQINFNTSASTAKPKKK